jgi:SlyX protein
MTADSDLVERLQELESQMAFQDELHSQLNDIVARQDGEIRELKQQVLALSRRLKEVGESMPGQGSDPADEVPPHY